jgi:hypothetical protein
LDNILLLATAAGSIAKTFIDVVRMGVEMPLWLPPTLAMLLGPILVFLFLLATSPALAFTWQLLATCILAGIVAAGYAVGATELARRGDVSQVKMAAESKAEVTP